MFRELRLRPGQGPSSQETSTGYLLTLVRLFDSVHVQTKKGSGAWCDSDSLPGGGEDYLLGVFDLEHTGRGSYSSDIIQFTIKTGRFCPSAADPMPPPDSCRDFNSFCSTTQAIAYHARALPGFVDLFTPELLRSRCVSDIVMFPILLC